MSEAIELLEEIKAMTFPFHVEGGRAETVIPKEQTEKLLSNLAKIKTLLERSEAGGAKGLARQIILSGLFDEEQITTICKMLGFDDTAFRDKLAKDKLNDYLLKPERSEPVGEVGEKSKLELYGDHLSSCAVRWTLESPKWQPCDCGFAQALKGGE